MADDAYCTTAMHLAAAKAPKHAKGHTRRFQPKRCVKKRALRRLPDEFVPSHELALV